MWRGPNVCTPSYTSTTKRSIQKVAADLSARIWEGSRQYHVRSLRCVPSVGYRRGCFVNRMISWNEYDDGLHMNHFQQRNLPTRALPAFPALAMRWKWTVDLSNDDNNEKSARENHVDARPQKKQERMNEISAAQPQTSPTKSDVPPPATNIFTYHGWDVLDTSEASPAMREVAEWDPVHKKIVKKVRLVTEEETQKAARRALRQKTKNREVLAKKDPLNKASRMCPICRKAFQGHNQMTSHLISREQCFNALEDPRVREKLLEQQTRTRSKMERRRLFRKAFNKKKLEEKEERKRRRLERLQSESEHQNRIAMKSGSVSPDSTSSNSSSDAVEPTTPITVSTDDGNKSDLNSDDSDREEEESKARIPEPRCEAVSANEDQNHNRK
jgi:hypothetical protein